MCGIAAILLCPQERPEETWQAIRGLFTRNLVNNEARGRAATGLAVVQLDGQLGLAKKALPASRFTETEEYRALLETVSSRTTLVLGHTRQPTKGDPACDENNHPILAGPVLGVHNGHITNDDALFACRLYPRSGEVDSEVIFRLLAEVRPTADAEGYLTSVRSQLEPLEGQLTFLACDRRAPTRLIAARDDNPLCLHYHVAWNALIFSSQYVFLRMAFGQSLLAETLGYGQLLLFDASTLFRRRAEPQAALRLLRVGDAADAAR